MYVAGEDALDQFFCRHPDDFLGRPVERAILDHESEEIHLAHLEAAAYELPLTPEDADVFGPRWEEHAQRLVKRAPARARGPLPAARRGLPGGRIALRSASPDSVAIVEASGGEVIGNVEYSRAPSSVHAGAVYLHMGAADQVEDLDLAKRRAVVEPFSGRLVHPAEEGVGDLHRAGARAPRDLRRRALVRDRVGDGAGRRVPEEEASRTSPSSTCSPHSICPNRTS